MADGKPVSAGELQPLLLSAEDLGDNYVQQPAKDEAGKRYDDISIGGCPALEKLGASAGNMKFATKVTADFTYDFSSELSEELHSDSPKKLSDTFRAVDDAYGSCPTYTMSSGTTPIEIGVNKVSPPKLGDEQFGYLITMNFGSKSTVMKQFVVRQGNKAIVLSGSPGLVEKHLQTAYNKLTAK
ncbi:hypothetical protein [Streptomyces halobius]|uniref:PknH-like protein n=1 Tax=Streptomyces halobius TaxID=2879846 RepID=A0ABY4M8M3_9ACTN|nr:hypothetical protein [Streptomyces halobius]UQA93707.1 hypothetical protein K9S39_19205 [Streptomyces halobius]